MVFYFVTILIYYLLYLPLLYFCHYEDTVYYCFVRGREMARKASGEQNSPLSNLWELRLFLRALGSSLLFSLFFFSFLFFGATKM